MSFNRSIKPEPRELLDFTAPKVEELYLNNGLRIFYVFKDKLPLVRLNLTIDAGSKFDPEDKKGLAYLTSLVIDEGAGDLSALELSDAFDMLGSSFSISADNDSINLSLQCLYENFEKSFDLFSKIILAPVINDEDFQREKQKQITQILQSKDEPEYLADQIFERTVFGDTNHYSFPVLGYEKTVQSITKNDIVDHYKNFFSPKNSFLVIAGNISKDELVLVLEKYLGNWNNASHKPNLIFDSPSQNKKVFLYHKEGSVQTEIRTGHISSRRNSKDYFQKLLMNAILGGQFTSRINLNLRERNGFTYGATSRFQYLKDAGLFQVATSVGSENTANALKEIFFELENIKNGISDKELEFAKSSITKKFPMNFETYRQIVFNIATKIMFDLPDNYFETYIDNINNLTKDEIENMAKTSINNDNLVVVLVSDKNLVKDQISSLRFEISEVDAHGKIIN